MANIRPIMKDLSQRDSSTNPDFVSRVNEAMLNEDISAKLEFEQKAKAGHVPTVRGVSDRETSLMERIAAQTEAPSNNLAYRVAERVNEHLKWVNQNMLEDKRRNAEYARELQGYLS